MIIKEAFWQGYFSQKSELEKSAMSPGMSALVGGGVGAGLGAGAGYLTADDEATSNQKLIRSLIGGGLGGAGGAGLGYGLGSMFREGPTAKELQDIEQYGSAEKAQRFHSLVDPLLKSEMTAVEGAPASLSQTARSAKDLVASQVQAAGQVAGQVAGRAKGAIENASGAFGRWLAAQGI